jgi:glucose-6-phosphate isomerase
MPGTDAQHTFFQWLHQGSDGAPVDFIVCRQADHNWPGHHTSLLANCLAQREVLLNGKTYDEALQECLEAGLQPEHAHWLAHHRVHSGGRPSSLIVLPRLSPYTLGALLALYEHKVFVQSVVWGINPFDQWGVEYGKVLAKGIVEELGGGKGTAAGTATSVGAETSAGASADTTTSGAKTPHHDASTRHWIEQFKKN